MRCLAVPKSVESLCLKWRSLSNLVPCSRVREEWSKVNCVVVKKALSQMAKLLIYCSVCVSTLTNGQELWVMTDITGCWTQGAKTAGCEDNSILMRVRSSAV